MIQIQSFSVFMLECQLNHGLSFTALHYTLTGHFNKDTCTLFIHAIIQYQPIM